MAYTTATPRSTFIEIAQHLFQRIGHGLAAVGKAMMDASEGNRRLQQVQALQSKSDAELAALNIKRDEIVQRVFGLSL